MQATNKFLVRQQDLNLWGALFGGKLLSELDVCGYYVARRLLQRVQDEDYKNYGFNTTAGFQDIRFLTPSYPGDIITLVGKVEKLGKTSIHIDFKGSKECPNGKVADVLSAKGVWVAMISSKFAGFEPKPFPHGLTMEEDQLSDKSFAMVASSDIKKIAPHENGITYFLNNNKQVILDKPSLERGMEAIKANKDFRSYTFKRE